MNYEPRPVKNFTIRFQPQIHNRGVTLVYCYFLKVILSESDCMVLAGTVEPWLSDSRLSRKKIQLSGRFELAITISVHLLATLTVTLYGNVAFHLSEFFTYPNASMSQAERITKGFYCNFEWKLQAIISDAPYK